MARRRVKQRNRLRCLNLFARIRAAAAAFANRYEAGVAWQTERSHLPGNVQDVRFDADRATRVEIVRKSRYFERNSAVYNRLVDLFEQYTVGPHGLRFVPASSDQEWNRKASESWAMWERFCDLTSLHPFGTVQSLIARLWFVDGEAFVIKTYGREQLAGGRTVRRPRIQVVEGHRVETPGGKGQKDRIFDGIEVNDDGRPIAYHIRLGLEADKFTRVLARDVVHIFEPARAGQLRGLPMVYPVLNDLHDLDDLQSLQMKKSKDAADVTNVFMTGTGEVPRNGVKQSRYTETGSTSANVQTSETRIDYVRQSSGGGRTIALKTGETLTQHRSDTPSIADQQHWDYVLSKVCAGVGISKLLVFPSSMQGTVVRADLDTAAAFFRSRSAVLAAAFDRIYQWVMEEATLTEVDLSDPPADWRRVTVRPPRSVNVDVGRNSSALIAEYTAGWRTLEAICGEMGEDYREVMRQRASEMSEAAKLETEFQLPAGTLIGTTLNALKQGSQQPAGETKPKEEEMQTA